MFQHYFCTEAANRLVHIHYNICQIKKKIKAGKPSNFLTNITKYLENIVKKQQTKRKQLMAAIPDLAANQIWIKWSLHCELCPPHISQISF